MNEKLFTKTSTLWIVGGVALACGLLLIVVALCWDTIPEFIGLRPTATPDLPVAAAVGAPPTSRANSMLMRARAVLPTPTPSPTPTPAGVLPVHLQIETIALDAPVVPISITTTTVNGESRLIWKVPDVRAAGWHNTSALLGVVGNVVLNGHNTLHGEVFRDLYLLEPGALVQVTGADGQVYPYTVAEKLILPENGQPLEVRIQNARYIEPTDDMRLTLITCHPYGSLSNRLVIIAYPGRE